MLHAAAQQIVSIVCEICAPGFSRQICLANQLGKGFQTCAYRAYTRGLHFTPLLPMPAVLVIRELYGLEVAWKNGNCRPCLHVHCDEPSQCQLAIKPEKI